MFCATLNTHSYFFIVPIVVYLLKIQGEPLVYTTKAKSWRFEKWQVLVRTLKENQKSGVVVMAKLHGWGLPTLFRFFESWNRFLTLQLLSNTRESVMLHPVCEVGISSNCEKY